MWVASKPSRLAARVRSNAAVCAPSPPDPANLMPTSPPKSPWGNAASSRVKAGAEAPTARATTEGSNDGSAHAGQGSGETSFFTPSGNTGTICSFTHRDASRGDWPR